MLHEVEFLFDNQLIAAVEKLIRDAKKSLLLISPYIDLDARIVDALQEKKYQHNFELLVLFGKNEGNYMKSLKRDSVSFLKEFPNIQIRYNERLHAKFYQNDFEFIMTSLNLYDYSLANNIEVGVRSEYATRGLLGKALDVSSGMFADGIEKVKHDILGIEKDVNPIDKFQAIFEGSDLIYKTQPKIQEKTGLIGVFSKKQVVGFDVLVNKLSEKTVGSQPISVDEIVVTSKTIFTEVKCMSASQIAKVYGKQTKEVTEFMQSKGFVLDDTITEAGRLKGLITKTYMGNKYIAYPENLSEIKELSEKL